MLYHSPFFSMAYTILIGDINYGQHVGGDALVKILHEARLRFLAFLGPFSEKSLGENTGLIMTSFQAQFKQQLCHMDTIQIVISVISMKRAQFALQYHIFKDGDQTLSHQCETSFAFFSYTQMKCCAAPSIFIEALKNYQTSLPDTPHGIFHGK